MNPANFKEQLQNYQERVKKYVEKDSLQRKRCHDENNTTIKIVIPLLEILGWVPESDLMEFEYTTRDRRDKTSNKVGWADIALYASLGKEDKPIILIEVKKIQNDIPFKRPTKIFEYMTHEGIAFGIATNGRQLLLYDNYRVGHSSCKGSNLVNFRSLKDLMDYREALNLFSRKSVVDGKLNAFSRYFHEESRFHSWRKSLLGKNKDWDEDTLKLKFACDFVRRSEGSRSFSSLNGSERD